MLELAGTVNVGDSGSIELTAGTLKLASTGTLNGTISATGGTLELAGKLNLTSAISVADSVLVTISDTTVFNFTESLKDGDAYTLISAGGTINGWDSLTSSNFTYNGEAIAARGLTSSEAGVVSYNASAATAKTLTWNGDGSAVWKAVTITETPTAKPWLDGSSNAEAFYNGDSVTFSGDAAVTVDSAGVTAGTVTINAETVSFSGGTITALNGVTATGTLGVDGTLKSSAAVSAAQLSGSGILDLGSTGTLTLSNATKFDNWKGTVKLADRTSNIALNNYGKRGSTIELAGFQSYFNEGDNGTVDANIVLKTTASNDFGAKIKDGWNGKTITFSGTVSGEGKLWFTAENTTSASIQQTFVFTGDVSGFSGGFTQSGAKANGILNFGDGGASVAAADASVSGTGDIAWNGKSVVYNYSSDVRASNNITSAVLTKRGAGSLTLTGTNTYTGGTTVEAGTLIAANASALGTGTVTAAGSDGVNEVTLRIGETGATTALTLANNISVSAGKTLILESSNDGNTLSGELSGAGKLTVTGTGKLTLSGADTTHGNTISGGVVIDGATLSVNSTAWGNKGNLGRTFEQDKTVLKNGGVLEVTAAQNTSTEEVYGKGGAMRGFSVTSGEGTYRYTGTETSYIAPNLNNGVLQGNSHIDIADGATLIFDVTQDAATLEVSKVIAKTTTTGTEATTGALKKTGAGTLTLSGDNTFTGGVTLSAGTLEVGHNNALGNSNNALTVSGNSELKIGSGLNVAHRVGFDMSATSPLTLTVNAAADTELSGTLLSYAANELRKTGAGALTLSGDNSGFMHGVISIEEGTVIAGHANALGTVSQLTNNKVRLSGGQLEVGSGVRLEQTNIEIALSSAYAMTAAITGAADAALAAGTAVTISSIDTADLAGVSLLAESAITRYEFKIAETLTDGLTASDFSLAQGLQDSGWGIVGYENGTLSLTLTVPEPSVFGLLAGLGALALAGTRRRRKKA